MTAPTAGPACDRNRFRPQSGPVIATRRLKENAMRVSFDLDEVLFVNPKVYEIEEPPRGIAGLFFKERLRKGTVELIRELQKRGFEAWVYTSSFRSEGYIKKLFAKYGVTFDGIVNGERHNREVQRGRAQKLPQKMPPYYRISLHIDDEESIIRSGVAFGFRTFRVYEPDDQWVQKVLDEAERVRSLEEKIQKMRSAVENSEQLSRLGEKAAEQKG